MSTAERHRPRAAHPDVSGLAQRASARLRAIDVSALERRWTRGRTLRVPYRACHDLSEIMGVLAELAPRTAIVDIEPLVADWNTDRRVLDAGIAAFAGRLAAEPGRIQSLVFATNSARRPGPLPDGHPSVRYISHAGKPLRTDPFRGLVRPGVVVGDQIATDGVLAWRLGLTFVHYIPEGFDAPLGPRVMRALGQPLRRLLFRDL